MQKPRSRQIQDVSRPATTQATGPRPYPDSVSPPDGSALPELHNTVIVAAFEGWNDAGDAASDALEHLDAIWEAEIIEWYVAEGDSFTKGQALAQIDSAKSVFDFESPCEGKVIRRLHLDGETVPLTDPIIEIDDEAYYDYQVNRPVIRQVDGVTRELVWPAMRISQAG